MEGAILDGPLGVVSAGLPALRVSNQNGSGLSLRAHIRYHKEHKHSLCQNSSGIHLLLLLLIDYYHAGCRCLYNINQPIYWLRISTHFCYFRTRVGMCDLVEEEWWIRGTENKNLVHFRI